MKKMRNKTTKDTPEKPSQASAETSGAHEAVAGELAVVVDHMRKSNGYVKETNQELIKLNKGQGTQNRWLKVISLLLTVLLVAAFVGWKSQHNDAAALTAELVRTNARLDSVILTQRDTKKTAEDTKKAIDEQPTITVKPADTADPSSKPTLVVQPKAPKGARQGFTFKKGDPPPKPAALPSALEFPLDPPTKKKK